MFSRSFSVSGVEYSYHRPSPADFPRSKSMPFESFDNSENLPSPTAPHASNKLQATTQARGITSEENTPPSFHLTAANSGSAPVIAPMHLSVSALSRATSSTLQFSSKRAHDSNEDQRSISASSLPMPALEEFQTPTNAALNRAQDPFPQPQTVPSARHYNFNQTTTAPEIITEFGHEHPFSCSVCDTRLHTTSYEQALKHLETCLSRQVSRCPSLSRPESVKRVCRSSGDWDTMAWKDITTIRRIAATASVQRLLRVSEAFNSLVSTHWRVEGLPSSSSSSNIDIDLIKAMFLPHDRCRRDPEPSAAPSPASAAPTSLVSSPSEPSAAASFQSSAETKQASAQGSDQQSLKLSINCEDASVSGAPSAPASPSFVVIVQPQQTLSSHQDHLHNAFFKASEGPVTPVTEGSFIVSNLSRKRSRSSSPERSDNSDHDTAAMSPFDNLNGDYDASLQLGSLPPLQSDNYMLTPIPSPSIPIPDSELWGGADADACVPSGMHTHPQWAFQKTVPIHFNV